jgi:hypothetical protein
VSVRSASQRRCFLTDHETRYNQCVRQRHADTRRSLPWALLALMSVVLLASNASATAVLIAISESRVLLAADGMSIHTRKGLNPTTSHHCKIDQSGDYFFIVVGVEDYPGTGLNIPTLARQAFRGPGDLSRQVGRFEKAANGPIIETLRYIKKNDTNLYALMSAGSGPRISVVFAGKFKGGLGVVVLEYVEAGGAFKENPPKVTLGGTAPVYQEIGDVAAIDAYMQNRDLRNMDDVDWFRRLLGVEIASQPIVGLQKVGPPVSILEISSIGARWIDQGACPDLNTPGQSRRR